MRTSHAALMRLAEKGAVNLGPVERLASIARSVGGSPASASSGAA